MCRHWFGDRLFFLLFPAIFLGCLYGTRIGSLVATAVAAFGVIFFFMEPLHTPWVNDAHNLLSIILFIGTGVISSFLSDRVLKESLRAQELETRKQTEDELKRIVIQKAEQAQIFDTALATSSEFHFIFDRNLKFLYANQSLLELLDTPLSELVGKTIGQVGLPEGLTQSLQSQLLQALKGEKVRGEYSFESSSHKIRSYEYLFVPVVNESGAVHAVSGSGRDVSARKEEEQLRLHEEKQALILEQTQERERGLALLANSMPQIVYISDHNGHVKFLNDRWYQYTGTKQSDENAMWMNRFVHPDDLEDARDAWLKSRIVEKAFASEMRLRGRDGNYRWFISRAVPVYKNGDVLEWHGTLTDIDDQKQAVEALRQSEDRLNVALTSGQIGLWDWHAKTNFVYLSDTLKHDWGIDSEKFTNTLDECMERIHQEDRARIWKEIQHSLTSGHPYNVEYRVIRPSGEIIWVNAIGKYVLDDMGQPHRLTGVTINITERRKTADELNAAKLEAERASRMKSAFLANMSHEIRTPLAAIVGYTELLRPVLPRGTSEDYLDRIIRNSDQLSRLIDDLLDLTKIEANRLEIEYLPVELDSVIDDLNAGLSLRAQEKNLYLDFNWLNPKPKTVLMDRMRLVQILTNIVGNAIKFTENGGVKVLLSTKEKTLYIRVTDTGIGLTDEQKQGLFQPFIQADSSITRRYGGTGLGLALSKRLAQLMGGDIQLERSAPGQGTEFLISIQYKQASPLTISQVVPEQMVAPNLLQGIKILIVDDSKDNRIIVSLFLKNAGATVVEASNGRESLKLASSTNFDLIFMDLQMPELDGYQTFQKLREQGVQTPVVALTAHALQDERDRCLNSGFANYVTKPVNRSHLVQTAREFARPQVNDLARQ